MEKDYITLVANTGIQFVRIPGVTIDLNDQLIRKLSFLEFEQAEGDYVLDQAYYFANEDFFVSKANLSYYYGLSDSDLFTLLNQLPEGFSLEGLRNRSNTAEELISINSLEPSIRHLKNDAPSPPELLLDNWLPVPFYEDLGLSYSTGQNNWARLKIILKKKERHSLIVDLLLVFDTDTHGRTPEEAPIDFNEPYRMYSYCGMSREVLNRKDESERSRIERFDIPNIIFQFWSDTAVWSADRLCQILHGDQFDISRMPEGKRMSFAAYYMYLLNHLYALDVMPRIKFCAAKDEPILVNLVLDVGNSRTFGLLAEEPIDHAFSNAKALELTELNNGLRSGKPFEMRLAFRKEDFGHYNTPREKQFIWPGILAIGAEAQTYIYRDTGSYSASDTALNTYYSSPKRYLWDTTERTRQWEFAHLPEDSMESRYISVPGITPPQFLNDGRFTPDPEEGARICLCNFSRCSLMTFCFLEVMLQANMQINSFDFRHTHGQEEQRRKINKVIITAPTATTKQEQIALRQCAQEAAVVLYRYRTNQYAEPFDIKQMHSVCEVIPSVKDLKLPESEIEERRSWAYDEASCSQMVYLYSEMKRFLGKSKDFFDLYGHVRKDIPFLDNAEGEKTLTIGSLDIGSGTTDLMICNYSSAGSDTVTPYPLYWDSFTFSGADLMKSLITQVIIEDYSITEHTGYAGVITNKLREMGVPNISTLVHEFFDDSSGQSVLDRKMRSDFNIQFSIPLIYKMLDLLQRQEPDQLIAFNEIFETNSPNASLLDYFAHHFGFRLEEIVWKFKADYLNDIIRRVFEPYLRKWSAVFNAYACDIVLLSGRPTSLRVMQELMTRLYAVSPNRLISMNDYRVGSWYPGSDSIGYFTDRKSIVAVGALISYLAEMGKLDGFKLKNNYLKKRVLPTADYIGLINNKSADIENIFFTPESNRAKIEINSFPMYIGGKQLNTTGYPARLLYRLDFNEDNMRKTIRNQKGELPAAEAAAAVEEIKHHLRTAMPLTVGISRAIRENKEDIIIESVTNANKEEVPAQYIKLFAQSIMEDDNDWLNSGRFVLRIGLNSNTHK